VFFGKAGCADCHAVNGRGRYVSTDLTDYAYDHDSDEIREAIVKPMGIASTNSAALVTKAGQKVSGAVRNESNSSIQIQDAKGNYFLLEKSDVSTMERSSIPAMPKDYSQRLSAGEISDLVSYIVHQVSLPKPDGTRVRKRKKVPFD
jgi:putative heme-binding domain-containing protein